MAAGRCRRTRSTAPIGACELAHLPRLAQVDGARAPAPVQAPQPPRPSSGGRARVATKVTRPSPSARPQAPRAERRSTPRPAVGRGPHRLVALVRSAQCGAPPRRRRVAGSPGAQQSAGRYVRAGCLARRPLPRRQGQEPARAASRGRARRARAGDARDVVEAAVAVGPTFVVTPDEAASRRGGARRRPAPAGRARRCAPGSTRPSPPAGRTVLVVNADLPCVDRARPALARGAVPAAGLRSPPRPTGRPTRSRSRPATSSSRSTGPAAPHGSPRSRRRASVESPNLVDDVDTLADLERSPRASARTPAARSPCCGCGAAA